MISKDSIILDLVELIKEAEVSLPKDIEAALKKAYRIEGNKVAKTQLKEILKNVAAARKKGVPLCQDTGLLNFYVKIGENAPLKRRELSEAIIKATEVATEAVPLRPNVVHPVTRKNTKNNVGLGVPQIDFEDVLGEHIEVTVLPKGAGSDNMARLAMLNPSEGIDGIKAFVLKSIANSGGNVCPPSVVGIGIGGSPDLALRLAKRALIREIGKKSRDRFLSLLEKQLMEEINSLGIGPMGLGGETTCLGVNIESAFCHTGSLPVAVNISCWALRRATARVC